MIFRELAQKVLEITKTPMTPREIWNYAEENGFLKEFSHNSKTPVATLNTVLLNEINKEKTIFIRIENKYALKNQESIENKIVIKTEKKNNQKIVEKDLYVPFIEYINKKFDCKAKRINEIAGKQKGDLEWSQPDIVSVHIPKFDNDTNELMKNLQVFQCKIYSFELKLSLDNSSLKKCYFQAVSNSSWSNEGYLVAKDINDNILDELKRLNNSFGIGVIKFNLDCPEKSEIILPAKTKDELDWITINKLEQIPDFAEFIKGINNFIKSETWNDKFFK